MNERMQAMKAELLQQRAANAALEHRGVLYRPKAGDKPQRSTLVVWGSQTCSTARRRSGDTEKSPRCLFHNSVSQGMGSQGGERWLRLAEEPLLNAVLGRPGTREASQQLAFILVMTRRAAA